MEETLKAILIELRLIRKHFGIYNIDAGKSEPGCRKLFESPEPETAQAPPAPETAQAPPEPETSNEIPSLQNLRDLFMQGTKEGKKDKLLALLKEFGGNKIPDIPQGRWAALYIKAEAVVNELPF